MTQFVFAAMKSLLNMIFGRKKDDGFEIGVFKYDENRFYCYYNLLRVSGKIEELDGVKIYKSENEKNIIKIDENTCIIEAGQLDELLQLLKSKGIGVTIEEKERIGGSEFRGG